MHGQGLHDGVASGPTAQLPERFRHWVVGFLASVALDTLTARNANAWHVSRRLALELVGQRGFPDARLARYERDLPLAFRGPPQAGAHSQGRRAG